MNYLKLQERITKTFLWTSPFAILFLLLSNYPELEKVIMTSPLGLFLAFALLIWMVSLIFVLVATFVSAKFKERVLSGVVLSKDRDEREALISGRAAKKSILVTMAATVFILLCTTGQYSKTEATGDYAVTIGHFNLSDGMPLTSQNEDGTSTVHYGLPMSKMSLVLLLLLVQLSSYHAINLLTLKRSEA